MRGDLRRMERRIVDVRLARIAPNGEIREREGESVLRVDVVKESVFVHVAAAVHRVARETDPVLDDRLAGRALGVQRIETRLGHGRHLTEMRTRRQRHHRVELDFVVRKTTPVGRRGTTGAATSAR